MISPSVQLKWMDKSLLAFRHTNSTKRDFAFKQIVHNYIVDFFKYSCRGI